MVSKRSLRYRGEEDDPVVDEPSNCPLCGRVLILGPSVDEHHLVPKSQGGREKFLVHRVCHQKIHQALKPRELSRQFSTWEALKQHPDIEKFIEWVQKRPPEFIS